MAPEVHRKKFLHLNEEYDVSEGSLNMDIVFMETFPQYCIQGGN